MKLEHQVCNLELARQLKELQVKQESEYEWEWEWDKAQKHKPTLKTSGVRGCRRCGAVINGIPLPSIYADKCAAFSVAELGEMLPVVIKRTEAGQGRNIRIRFDGPRTISYEEEHNYRKLKPVKGLTEADARAKMLIHLIENKLLTVE
jgi:hypothetical protein